MKHFLIPENDPKLSVPLNNKEMLSQLNSNPKKLIFCYKFAKEHSIAQDSPCPSHRQLIVTYKGSKKFNAISLMGHSLKDTLAVWQQKIKPLLNGICFSLCDLEYKNTKHLFREHINKSLNRAKDVGSTKKQIIPETTGGSKTSQQFNKTKIYERNYFLYKDRKQLNGIPKQVQTTRFRKPGI